MITIDILNEWGADTTEGLTRCIGNEELYLKLVNAVTKDPNFDKLKTLTSEGDLKGAFEASHALKGVLGNLSLTPIYKKVCEITELLRAETDIDYSGLVKEITEMRDQLLSYAE